MNHPRLIVFDDAGGRWGPMTDMRPVFELRTGMLTTLERVLAALRLPLAGVVAPPAYDQLLRQHDDRGAEQPVSPQTQQSYLFVNGRWTGTAGVEDVRALRLHEAATLDDGQIIAAHLSPEAAQAFFATRCRQLPAPAMTHPMPHARLIQRPWDILAQLEAAIRVDVEHADAPRLARKRTAAIHVLGDHPVLVQASARLYPMIVLNAESGPIHIASEAQINSFSILTGPCTIGEGAVVAPHTQVRANTVIGPHCVAGGEISHSILHGYSNKAHAGYLGNSLVGQWANLGADTNVSNLKNTYGSVRMELSTPPWGEVGRGAENREAAAGEDTGQPKLGPVIGDFVRTAIGTRLPTGSVVGTASMLAISGFAPKCTPGFTFHTDEGAQRYDVEKLLTTVRQMMARREQTLSAAEEARLRELSSEFLVPS